MDEKVGKIWNFFIKWNWNKFQKLGDTWKRHISLQDFPSCIFLPSISPLVCLFVPFVKNEEARGSSRSCLHMCHDRATAGDEKWGSHLSPRRFYYLYIPAIVPQYKVYDVRSIMQSALLCSCCSPQHFVYSKIELPLFCLAYIFPTLTASILRWWWKT